MLRIRRSSVDRQLRVQARQQAAVAELGQRALAGVDVAELTHELVDLICEVLELDFCAVWELLPGEDLLALRNGKGWKESYVGHTVVGAGSDSMPGFTLLSRAPVVMEDMRRDTRFTGPNMLQEHGAISGISAIIAGRERPFGVLAGYSRHVRRFTSDDIHFMQAMANVLAAANDRKRTEEALQRANSQLTSWVNELKRRNHESTVLNEMGELLQTCQAASEAYVVVAQAAGKLFPEERGALCVISESRNIVEAVATWGDELRGERVFPPASCWALRRGRIHMVNGSGLVCRHVEPVAAEATICVPMMAQGDAIGMLHLQGRAPAPRVEGLSDSKQRLAVTLAEHFSLALANLKLRETLRSQSIRDPLTGLYNRRYMEESLEREVRRAERRQRPLGLIMLDLDHFKQFNDTLGHSAGDALLREVGAFLQRRTRDEDIACRYGGEEFMIILPEATLEVTQQRAEALRNEVKDLRVDDVEGAHPPVSVSLGVAVYPDHGNSVGALLRSADQALYRAKRLGRDRTVSAGQVRAA